MVSHQPYYMSYYTPHKSYKLPLHVLLATTMWVKVVMKQEKVFMRNCQTYIYWNELSLHMEIVVTQSGNRHNMHLHVAQCRLTLYGGYNIPLI